MNQLFNIAVLGKGLQALKTAASLRVTPPVRRLNRFSFTIRCFYFQPSHLGLLRVEISRKGGPLSTVNFPVNVLVVHFHS